MGWGVGGTWWPGSLLPSPLLLPHGWSLETPSVTLPGSLDLDKAFVPFFSLQDQQKWKQQIQDIWDREGRRSENRGKETRSPCTPQAVRRHSRCLELPVWRQKHEAPTGWKRKVAAGQSCEGWLQFTVVTLSLTGENGVGTCGNSCLTLRNQIPGKA